MANPTVNELLEEIKIYLESQGGTYTPLADRPWPATVELESAIAQMLMQLIPSPAGGEVFANNTVVIDAVFGNDSTGEFERIDKPFQTFAAAFASLPTSGDLNFAFIVRPGTYNESFDFDLYLNTSPATFSIYYEVGTQQLGNNTNSIFKCSSASKGISLYIYNANILQTFPKKVCQNGNTSNLIYFINCKIQNTGGSSLIDPTNSMYFENCNFRSNANLFNGFANGGFTIRNCKFNFTAGGIGSPVGNFFVEYSTIIAAANCAIVRGITASNSVFKSTTTDCINSGVLTPLYFYNCTFVPSAGRFPIKTNGLAHTGAANGCSGNAPTLTDLPTSITDNYFQNTQNAY